MVIELNNLLVVEDTQGNLAAAKKYFSKIKKLSDIDYCETRDDAIKMIAENKYEGVITDRGLPISKDSSITLGGYHVALEAEVNNIPWVIASEHGFLTLYYPKMREVINEEFCRVHRERSFDDDSLDILFENSVETGLLTSEKFMFLGDDKREDREEIKDIGFLSDLVFVNYFTPYKSFPGTWGIVYDRLKSLV